MAHIRSAKLDAKNSSLYKTAGGITSLVYKHLL